MGLKEVETGKYVKPCQITRFFVRISIREDKYWEYSSTCVMIELNKTAVECWL